LNRGRPVVAKRQTEGRQERQRVAAGRAEQPLGLDWLGVGRVSHGSGITPVTDQVPRRRTLRTEQGTGYDKIGELRGVALDVLTKIHDNDHGSFEAPNARTDGKRGA